MGHPFLHLQTMARQDIDMDASYGEVTLTDNLADKRIYPFKAVEAAGINTEKYCLGEIAVPANFESRYKDTDGIHVHIPYTPQYKELKIRFKFEKGDGNASYLINRTDNSIWFTVFSPDMGTVYLSAFRAVNSANNFNLIMREGALLLFSADETDFIIKPSLEQTKIFLLKASAGNLYQHMTTGVGLIRYLHGNFENSNLASKLQQEFQADGMIIKNAYMDSQTGELLLDVEEKQTE